MKIDIGHILGFVMLTLLWAFVFIPYLKRKMKK